MSVTVTMVTPLRTTPPSAGSDATHGSRVTSSSESTESATLVSCYPAHMIATVPGWTFLTNHAHVLLCIAREPGALLREIAGSVGITERAAQRIVGDLEADGYLERHRVGRRNTYTIHPELHLHHPMEEHLTVGSLIDLLAPGIETSP